jgi:hypothetical protein
MPDQVRHDGFGTFYEAIIIHLGGENTVTGSCHLLRANGLNIMIDCGLVQGDHPIDFDHLYDVEDHRDHLKLCDMDGQAVIIAGSGMCTGGRILKHLKAGITRWAQVNYRYGASIEDARRKLEYDLYYIKNMSLILDIKIILKTIGVVLFEGVR